MTAKYELLEMYLRRIPLNICEVTLSFSEIHSILSDDLPESAYEYREWWSNQDDISRRPQSYAWQKAGFNVDVVQLSHSNGWVRFVRK